MDARRGSRHERGYGGDWPRVRLAVLAEEPMCRACGEQPATDVDHIVPMAQGGSQWDWANLQPLCHRCHSAKTMRELNAKRVS